MTAGRISALIVDDERLARQELRALLAVHPDVRVTGEAASLDEASRQLAREQPDVIFLDIQMPGESGFDLFARVPVSARVIFVTAHDAHALRAFDVNALDYLLKPVAPARLAEALERLRRESGAPPPATRRFEPGDFVFLPVDGRSRFLRLSQVVSIAAAGDATTVTTADGLRGRVPRSLKAWDDRLPPRQFVRIHRETIVNLQYVERIEEWSHEAFQVHLRGQAAPLTLSRRYAARLRARFS
ncbi:MAG TPA: LytTR family DNA-binding domain-containing protein [Gemmatimonadales bacterium]|nr:LytTR family DNA-binding domain-containing protein [Gemmatimonadales bacterium]